MVFEGILVEILNTFLGDYIENLDKEQLSLAVWSGNIELRELQTKESLLDDLNYPIRTKFGYLGKLRVEIPWKNLYTHPITIIIEDILLLAAPNDEAQYDKEKTEKRQWEQKQRQLKHLELIGGSETDAEEAKSKEPVKTKSTFTERLIAKLINNLQVEIKNVHVRYEGEATDKRDSFCFGATLGSVLFKSTDEQFNIHNIGDVCHLVYKILSLEYLSAYCSPKETTIFSGLEKEKILERFQDFFESSKEDPSPVRAFHVLEPVFFTSRVALNPKPESPESGFAAPKMTIDMGLEAIKLKMSRSQYAGVLEFLESMEGLTSKSRYSGFDIPQKPLDKNNARKWWEYAAEAVLEVDVRPRMRQWSWQSIKEHRQLLRQYSDLYSKKLNSSSVSASDEKSLEDLEKKLDVFNIVLARHQAQFEVNKKTNKVSWWGWLTGKSATEDISDENDIRHKLKKAMTEEERAKLHSALGLAENVEHTGGFPAEYVSTRLLWDMEKASLTLYDDADGGGKTESIANLSLKSFSGKFEQRPTADGLYLKTEVKDLVILGKARGDKPTIIAKPEDGTPSWLQMLYESNPLDSEFGVRVHLFVDPVKLTYDAETVNAIVKFFKPPEAIALKQLQAQAIMALQALRESTVAAVRDILENHRYTDFDVDFKAPYLVIPEYGSDAEDASCVVVDFGRIQLMSVSKGGELNPDIASMEDLKEQSYEKYQLTFQDLSIIFAEQGDDWQAARKAKSSPLQLLHSISCSLQLQNCLIRNHPLLPLGRVFGDLPNIILDISEDRLLKLLKMLLTIPLPDTSYSGNLEFSEKARDIVREYHDMKQVQTLFTMKQKTEGGGAVDDVVVLEFQLIIQELSISILNPQKGGPPLFRVAALNFEQGLSMTASEMISTTALNDLFVEFTGKESNKPKRLIQAHRRNNASPDSPVLNVKYTSVSSLSPVFESKHACTLSRIDAEFAGLELVVDQKVLLDIAQFVGTLRDEVTAVVSESEAAGPRLLSSYFNASPNAEESPEEAIANDAASTDLTAEPDEGFVSEDKLVHFAVHAVGEIITIALADSRGVFCRSIISGLDVGFQQKKSSMIVEANLRGISLENPDETAKWPMILRTKGEELMAFKGIFHLEPMDVQRERGLFSTEIDLTLGAVEFVFLNVFFMDISRFAEALQGIFAKLSGVAQAATEKTKQAATDAYEQASRIKLELDLKAPIVILPQNSKSTNALVFDLGSLRVANNMVAGEDTLIDHMTVSISSIAFDRVENYTENGAERSFSIIKQPDTTEMVVKRNLNYKEDASIPEIDADGLLPSFELNLSNVDYQVILDTFTQNFAEGTEEKRVPPPSQLPEPSLETVKEEVEPGEEPLSGADVRRGDLLETPSPTADAKPDSPQTVAVITEDPLHPSSATDSAQSSRPEVPRFKFLFNLDKITATLEWKNPPKNRRRATHSNANVADEPAPGEKLAYFELAGFHIDGAIMPNFMIQGEAAIQDLNVQDCRGNFDKRISRLIYLRSSTEKSPPLLLVEAKQDEYGNQSLDVRIAQFEIAVILDFFMELGEFFAVKKEQPEEDKQPGAQAPLRKKVQEKAVDASRNPPPQSPTKGKKPVLPVVKSPEEGKETKTMVINVVVDSPTILLIEDPKNLDSKVLLLSLDMKMNMGMAEGGQSFQASAENFRMFATHYKNRAVSPQQIISPFDMALQYKKSVDSGQHVGLTCTDIIIIITPAVVKVITTTLAGLGNISATEELPENPVGVYLDLWDPKPVAEDHWFLQPTEDALPGDKILTALEQTESQTEKQLQQGDLFMFDMPSVMIVVEIGEVNRYAPAFLLEFRAFGTVRDWTTRLQAKGILFLEMGTYNPKHDVWEPLIEPVDDGKTERPWEVSVEIIRNDISISDLRTAAKQGMNLQRRGSVQSVDSLASPPPGVQDVIPDTIGSDVLQESAALQINLKATAPLELTVTKTAVDLVQTVVESFMEAANKDLPLQEAASSAPYIVQNHLGIDVRLQVIAPLQYGVEENVTSDSDGMIQVKSGGSREIYLSKKIRKFHKNVLHQSQAENDLKMKLIVAGRTLEISLQKAERRFFFIQNSDDVQRPYRLIVDVVAETSYKAIHLQSSMTVTSYLLMPMELQGGFASVDHTGVVDPNQTVFMPIRSVQFDEKAVLSCRPAHSEMYQQSKKIPIGEILRMDAEEKTYVLQCDSTKLGVDPTLYFVMFCRVQHIKYENTQKYTPNSVEYQVFLRSVITIANVLPYDISVGYADAKETRLALEERTVMDPNVTDNHIIIEAGNSRPLNTVHPERHRLLFRLKNYMEQDWDGEIVIGILKDEFTPCVLTSRGRTINTADDPDKQDTVLLGIRTLKEDGTIFLTIYSPFWMINKTGLMLTYKKPLRDHVATITQPLLYSTSYGNLQEKRKISVKVEDGEWSKKISPDAVGSNGVIVCEGQDRTFEIGMQIKHSATVITKIVVFTPYYVLSNISEKVAIDVRENHASAEWIILKPKQTLPFWPLYVKHKKEKEKEKDKDETDKAQQRSPDNQLICRIAGTVEESTPFSYGFLQNNLLMVKNRFGGIYVETQVSECNAITTLQPFYPGRSTHRLINMTERPVFYRQVGDVQFDGIQPWSERLFTWAVPFEEKKLEWFFEDNSPQQTDIEQDDSGNLPVNQETHYWVSFFHENERIMLFTLDVELALKVQQSVDLEPTSLELVASMESIGLSLVNNVAKHEVLYAGIVSGGPTWQWRKLTGNSKRFHNFKGREAYQLEQAFQKYKSNVEADIHIDASVKLEHSNLEVDFSQMTMSKPHHRQLQRIYEDGFWCRFKTSASQYQFHVKLQKMQIDNPNPLSQYPTIFIPVPVPESVGHKPLIEASLIIRQTPHSSVPQYKLMEILVQEVEARVDQGFINAIMSILQPEGESGFRARQKMLDNFHEQDGAELGRSLHDTVSLGTGTEMPVLFDHLVVHPLKLHISFSMTGADNEQQSALNIQSEFLGLFMRTLGVATAEVNDVLIRLATFERMHKAFTYKQMEQQLQSHYISQLLKQFYSIALGLDILGNPFGLIRGIGGGVRDLFYEPYEGAIEGPEEFMSGLGSGIQSLVGKSVGGVLGTAEKLTGSVGRAIASVSFDEKFIRQRQRDKNRTPTDLPGALAQSGKALGMGLTQGITGVVTKPIDGAKSEGVAGFFKGIGKGLIGIVVRPAAGVVDFATGSIEAVRRVTTSDVDPIRLRPTRHIAPDGVVRPYNLHQAEGAYIFRDIQKKELKDDEYVTHLVTSRERRYILVLTTKRVLYLEKGEILQGRFSLMWHYEWDHFLAPPSMSEKGIMFPVFEAQEKGLKGLLHLERKDKPRYAFVEDADSGEWFIKKVKDVMESMKEK